jgi:hypothetical protein
MIALRVKVTGWRLDLSPKNITDNDPNATMIIANVNNAELLVKLLATTGVDFL